ncbi:MULTISPECIES: sigma-70 family RNA polymerase sigma factor [Sediminibacillus]|uniref:sigma-70 family RNA polymerase sigma factor n=1 Tax=Sediminibacillus TaxID=482460 RepID=UPI001297950B|nr:sigma-70 family RNA polymerase sigma factor [Sediminibacillus terrae]
MKHSSLVKKAIKGDEAAFETLVKNESEKLYKTAFLYVKNKEDALDVLQETIYKAFVSINQVKKPEYFYTWLTKILIHTAYELLRKRKKVVYDENLIHHLPETEGNQDVETKMDLLNAISYLSEQYQTVIILFYYHDLPIHQIAETMEKPENTVKTYLRRAKKELKHYLEGVHHYGQRALS